MLTNRTASVLLLAATLAAQEAAPLRLSVPAAEPHFFRHSFTRNQKTEVNGEELVFATKLEHTMKLTVTTVGDDGVAQAEFTVLRTRGTMELPGGEGTSQQIAFDSANDDEADEQGIGPALTSFAGHSYALRIGKLGDVLEVQGVQEVLAEAQKRVQGMGRQLLINQVTPSNLKNVAQTLIGRLPEEPVGVGSSWQRETRDDLRGTMMLTRTKLTLGKRDKDRSEITFEGNIATPDAKPEQMRLTEGKLTGTEVLAPSGLVVSSSRKVSTKSEGPSPVGAGTITVASETEVAVAEIPEAEAKLPAKKPAGEPGKDEGKGGDGTRSPGEPDVAR